jgi:two-component system sensor histidine kinase RegB
MATLPDSPSREAINFSWLLKLRWGAIVGQVVMIVGVTRLFGVQLPLPKLALVIALEAATNLVLLVAARSGRAAEWWSGSVMVLDTILLTALLHLTGGPFNPFSFLYLVQIALAAVILPARWTWALVLLSLLGSGALFLTVDAQPADGLSHADHMALHLRGMWVAFGVAASFIVYFLMRVRRALETREADLAAARELGERQQRLASLATLAAGAAHELATPLSTIALAAKELERQLTASGDRAVADIQLIRSEVSRCRAILDGMAAEAGQAAGEDLSAVGVAELVQEAIARARRAPPVELALDAIAEERLRLPRRALTQALQSLLENAQDASPPDAPVRVVAGRDAGAIWVDVIDRGTGMSAAVLARVGEPFFTTKPAGRGMGLGLFLTRTLVESLGGSLLLDSAPGRGTRARVLLAADGAS